MTGFELFSRMFQKLKGTPYELSQNASNFLAGGLASNLYWLSALRESHGTAGSFERWAFAHLPAADNVKSRIMTDSLSKPKYRSAWHVVQTVLHEKDMAGRSRLGNTVAGVGNFYRVGLAFYLDVWKSQLRKDCQGIVPVVLRAFPTNAAALAVWEAVMRGMGAKEVSSAM
jgi:solute carrier family 25 carnitine/acylcarnitine transporter 20/29